ncbi:hypothetical protein C4M98_03340 [Mycoplasmopsis pullorum]|uniref:MSC_0622 family F1-like ATPase gamma subunit n=1 Tax=Mycoplasmopsis pullorum TaxID=48003 RepID=UPI00111A1B36|nr:hypothetical protein [Mycoplasmopsis pullorum]TNK81980.1 hypothetical protein C4M94_02375 [Mycoplasmopsis pullorum]TNK82514.1 hypothetical protein C4M80_02875 [Mycoplasmopsis pullorum]TNK85003.1 hypothetical protein C4M81_00560 [Mycoplasmopsis pullorum]TNK85610.1 hypothetical protein C4M92_00835 [Mycoplasmopsis pullorum]TNK86390.1 hypothetical protein C4M85_00290 [Mycoplasmopsis pullorum]
MHIKKIKTKLNSFSKLMKIVESNKNITLINILKLSKQISFYYERALSSKRIIESLLGSNIVNNPILNGETTFNIFNIKKSNKFSISKTIWIYVTEEEKYSTNSYLKYEKNLIKNIKKNDLIIPIGQRAINFATQNKYKILFSHSENQIDYLVHILPEFLLEFIEQNGFFNINFVINSSKTKQSFLSVLPLSKMDFNLNVRHLEMEKEMNIKRMNIYPNLNKFINSELNSYLTYMVFTLLNESALINEKYKLVAQNQKIHDLEKKYKQMHLSMLRGKRELEVEQLSLLSSKKDLLHTAGNYKEE